MTNQGRRGGIKDAIKSKSQKHTKGGVNKQRPNKPQKGKHDVRKAKAAAPTAEQLDNELMKYMGEEFVVKKLDDELESYLKSRNE